MSDRRRIVAIVLVGLMAIAAAWLIASQEAGRDDAVGQRDAQASAKPESVDVAREQAVDAATEGARIAAPQLVGTESREVAPQDADAASYYKFRVRVVDAGERGIQHVHVDLGTWVPWFAWQNEQTDQDGRATITVPRRIGPIDALGIVARLAGATAERSLQGCTEKDEIELKMPPLGWFALTVDGPLGNVGAQVVVWDGHSTMGATTTFLFDEATERVAVGLDQSYAITVWSDGERELRRDVRSPQRAGETVALAFDFRRCAVRFDLAKEERRDPAANPPGDETVVIVSLLVGTKCVRCRYEVDAQGVWTARVPRHASARLVVTSGSSSYESPPMEFGETVDLGRIALEPMKDFGTVEARMPDGSLVYSRQMPSAYVHADGRRLPASMATGPLVVANATDDGTRIASLRMFSAVDVVARADGGYYAEPPLVTLTGGTRAQVTMLAGAEVEIASVDAGTLHTMALLHRATGKRFNARESSLAEGRPQWKFLGLRPGDYDVLIDGMSSSPSTVHVPAGSKQRVAVTLTQK